MLNKFGAPQGLGQPKTGKQLPRTGNPAFLDQQDDNPLQPKGQMAPQQGAPLGGPSQPPQALQRALPPQRPQATPTAPQQAQGALQRAIAPALAPKAPAPTPMAAQGGGFAPSEPFVVPGGQPQAPQAPTPQGNDYKSFLMQANQAKQAELRGITDEGQREAAVEAHLRGMLPQLQAMGVNVGDIRKEKMQINGQWVDMFRDITNGQGTGAAEAQWLVEDGSGPQGGMPMGGIDPGSPALGAAVMGGNPQEDYSKKTLQDILMQLGISPDQAQRFGLGQV